MPKNSDSQNTGVKKKVGEGFVHGHNDGFMAVYSSPESSSSMR